MTTPVISSVKTLLTFEILSTEIARIFHGLIDLVKQGLLEDGLWRKTQTLPGIGDGELAAVPQKAGYLANKMRTSRKPDAPNYIGQETNPIGLCCLSSSGTSFLTSQLLIGQQLPEDTVMVRWNLISHSWLCAEAKEILSCVDRPLSTMFPIRKPDGRKKSLPVRYRLKKERERGRENVDWEGGVRAEV